MIVDLIENWQQYARTPAWHTAFEYLAALTPDAAEGETLLRHDDILARIMSYETRDAEGAALEAHRQYADIQMPLLGSEAVEWFPQKDLSIKTPYDSARDAEFYHRPRPAPVRLHLFTGAFAVFFPADAHMPQLMTRDRPEKIKKVVVKVRAHLL